VTFFREILQGCERGGRDRLRLRGNRVPCQLLSRAGWGARQRSPRSQYPCPCRRGRHTRGRIHIQGLFGASERGAGLPGLPSDGLSGFRVDGVSTGVREPLTNGLGWPREGIGRLATRKMPCPAGLFCICIDLLTKTFPCGDCARSRGEERPGI